MATIKCRKCRNILQCGNLQLSAVPCCSSLRQLVPISDELIPDWILPCLDQGSWIKGRLRCFSCQSNVGSFDFVDGKKCPCQKTLLPVIYLVKSKIDFIEPTVCDIHTATSAAGENSNRCQLNISSLASTHKMSRSWHGTLSAPPTTVLFRSISQGHVKEEGHVQAPHACEASSNDIKDVPRDPTEPDKFRRQISSSNHVEEESSAVISQTFICPICLELFVRPHTCHPCNHSFCEPCLKLLARCTGTDRSNSTHCPLCRQVICSTSRSYELERRLKNDCGEAYAARLAWLNKQQKFHKMPLPGVFILGQIRRLLRSASVSLSSNAEQRIYRTFSSLCPLTSFVLVLLSAFLLLFFVPSAYLPSSFNDLVSKFTRIAVLFDPAASRYSDENLFELEGQIEAVSIWSIIPRISITTSLLPAIAALLTVLTVGCTIYSLIAAILGITP